MGKKALTTEEITSLRESPYVASVLSGRISFTPEFKGMAFEELKKGKSMRDIFQENGIDPMILGDNRVVGFAAKLRANAGREEGFTDLRVHNSRKPKYDKEDRSLSERVELLERDLAYARQEMDFIRRIHAMDQEARRKWEARQHLR